MPRDTQPLFTQNHLFILGCGYLGQHVACEALRRGMRVTALTRNEAQAATLRAQGIDVIVADLASEDWHALAPSQVDFVLNCVSSGAERAASSALPASEDKLAARRRSYFGGMRSLTRWMRNAARVGTVVYTSSTGVYPQGGGAVVDEESPVALPDADTRSGILTAAEQLLQRDCEPALTHRSRPFPTRWFILRLAGLYGPGRSHLLDQVLKSAAPLGASASHRLNLVHVEDAAAAVWAAFAAPASLANRIYNVADDAPAPKCEVLTWLADQVGNFPQLPPVPEDGLPRSATASRPPKWERSQTAGGRPASVCDREQAANREAVTDRHRRIVPDRIISNARIKRDLGWQPRYPDYRVGYAKMLSR